MKLPFLGKLVISLLGIIALAPPPIYGQTQLNYIAQTPNSPSSTTSTATYQFTFTTSTEYTNCLEDIILLYRNKEQLQRQGRRSNCLADAIQTNFQAGLSQTQARQMIVNANRYATLNLTAKLFPPRGLREQIAALFGFIYEVDKNDQAIHKLVNEGASALDAPPPDPTEIEQNQPPNGNGW